MRTKPGIFRTQAFRIVLAYVLLFAFSVTALLGFTYWNTRRTLDAQTDQIIEAEITGLNEEYHHFGLPGLVETVRARQPHPGQAIYLLVDGLHHYVAGNLDSWPQIADRPASWSSSTMNAPSTASCRPIAPAAGSISCRGISSSWSPRMCMTAI